MAASLLPGDPVLDGSLIDYYRLYPAGPGMVTIEMAAEVATGTNVDPFLYLWAEGRRDTLVQAYDPTGEGPFRVARLAEGVVAGCYRVGASSWHPGEQGEYTIRAEFTPTP